MRRILAFGLLVGALGLVGVACGGDDEAATDEPAAAMEDTTTEETMADTSAAEMNIVETAVDAGSFTTLVSLVEEAGLADELSGSGPLTVFAPTDEAFAAVPEETLAALQKDPEALRRVLLYHVVEGEVTSEQVVGLDSAPTLAGSDLGFSVDGDAVLVNEAQVTMADVLASNGVIHVVDSVLLPPAR
jgi:transforming growth factor-beta-induced protein